VKFVAVSAGRAFAPAPENWQQPILDGITWAPLVGHPLARCTWLVWPANSHRRDLPHLVTAFETPGPDLEFARGVALAGTASLVGVRAEEATAEVARRQIVSFENIVDLTHTLTPEFPYIPVPGTPSRLARQLSLPLRSMGSPPIGGTFTSTSEPRWMRFPTSSLAVCRSTK
jgi:hypothetical protein